MVELLENKKGSQEFAVGKITRTILILLVIVVLILALIFIDFHEAFKRFPDFLPGQGNLPDLFEGAIITILPEFYDIGVTVLLNDNEGRCIITEAPEQFQGNDYSWLLNYGVRKWNLVTKDTGWDEEPTGFQWITNGMIEEMAKEGGIPNDLKEEEQEIVGVINTIFEEEINYRYPNNPSKSIIKPNSIGFLSELRKPLHVYDPSTFPLNGIDFNNYFSVVVSGDSIRATYIEVLDDTKFNYIQVVYPSDCFDKCRGAGLGAQEEYECHEDCYISLPEFVQKYIDEKGWNLRIICDGGNNRILEGCLLQSTENENDVFASGKLYLKAGKIWRKWEDTEHFQNFKEQVIRQDLIEGCYLDESEFKQATISGKEVKLLKKDGDGKCLIYESPEDRELERYAVKKPYLRYASRPSYYHLTDQGRWRPESLLKDVEDTEDELKLLQAIEELDVLSTELNSFFGGSDVFVCETDNLNNCYPSDKTGLKINRLLNSLYQFNSDGELILAEIKELAKEKNAEKGGLGVYFTSEEEGITKKGFSYFINYFAAKNGLEENFFIIDSDKGFFEGLFFEDEGGFIRKIIDGKTYYYRGEKLYAKNGGDYNLLRLGNEEEIVRLLNQDSIFKQLEKEC